MQSQNSINYHGGKHSKQINETKVIDYFRTSFILTATNSAQQPTPSPTPTLYSDEFVIVSGHPDSGFQFAGKREALPFFAPLTKILSEQCAWLSPIQEEVGQDISFMTEKGVPPFAPMFDTRTYFNYHHTAADTFDKIDPKDLQELGSLMAILGCGLANLEQPIPR